MSSSSPVDLHALLAPALEPALRAAGEHLGRAKQAFASLSARDAALVQAGLGAVAVGGLAYLLLRGTSSAPAPNHPQAEPSGSGGGGGRIRGAAGTASSSPSSAGGSAAADGGGHPSASSLLRSLPSLDKYEKQLLGDMVEQEALGSDFDDIGGLDDQIRTIEELVIFPLAHPHLYAHSASAQQPTGVLLYGPPGTGKTLLAKAIAKTARASFLNVNVAHIQSKWFGETPKLVEAVFTLARKASPCVVFVDEIDGVLAARNDMDMQHVNTMKTKFMEMWDGLTTAAAAKGAHSGGGSNGSNGNGEDWVLVIGATNKPWALDPAVLRRMPRQLYIGLPDASARAAILRVLLRRERADVDAGVESLGEVAQRTEGYSGSDLKELVRAAALVPIREAITAARAAARGAGGKGAGAGGAGAAGAAPQQPRALTAADLIAALASVKPTGVAAAQYRHDQAGAANSFSVGKGAGGASAAAAGGAAAAASPASSGSGSGSGSVVTFGQDVPVYLPSHSMRLNTQKLASAVEVSAGPTAPKVLREVPAGQENVTTRGAVGGGKQVAGEGAAVWSSRMTSVE
jgi:ATPase family AAA domain-containing protein 1